MNIFLLNMSRKHCNSTYILGHMDATITFLMKFSYDRSSALRMRYKAALCNAIAAALPLNAILLYLDHGPYDESKKVRENMGRSDTTGMLAAAAAVNSLPALRFLAGKVRHLALCSELYGAPLLTAAANENITATCFLYDYLKDTERFSCQLHYTIELCFVKHCGDTLLPILIGWYLPLLRKYTRRIAKKYYANWAVAAGYLEVLQMCWQEKLTGRSRICTLDHHYFYKACERGHPKTVECFIRATFRHANVRHLCKSKTRFCALTRVLWTACKRGWLRTAKLLLDHGADFNRVLDEWNTKEGPALHWAILGGNVHVVVLLLAFGAKVKNQTSITGLATRRGGAMAQVVWDAWREQQGVVTEEQQGMISKKKFESRMLAKDLG
jgi:hypothetical protein